MGERHVLDEEAFEAISGGVLRTIYNDASDYTYIRENPGYGSAVCFKAANGVKLDTTGETFKKDGYTWYEVHLEDGSDNGWIAGSLIGY